jgi:tRNA nucleotidyltransferase (CCA-adding enzyme)
VERLLRQKYGVEPIIVPAGSWAKGTMIREAYDIDVICYFENNGIMSEKSLKDIYLDVEATLFAEYAVERKRSALRLLAKTAKTYSHIDVVPGRFVDDTNSNTFLHQNEGDKERLQTDTKLHVKHIRDSGNSR